jgi:hypothetical protein
MPLTGRVALKRVATDESALYQRYASRPRSLATVQNRNAQTATSSETSTWASSTPVCLIMLKRTVGVV